MIQLLNLKPVGRYADGSPIYHFATSYPTRGVQALDKVHSTAEAARDEGVAFVKLFETARPYGAMGQFLGVTMVDGGYRAVVNTYFSPS